MKTTYHVLYKLEGYPWLGREVPSVESVRKQIQLYRSDDRSKMATADIRVEIRTEMTAEEYEEEYYS